MSSAKKRQKNPVHGVLILDKPKGMSSNQAMSRVRWLAKAAKAGHTGALDPMATGVLPICFGEATKFSQRMLDADKSYRATVRLGIHTDTYDAEGHTLTTNSCKGISDDQIQRVVQEMKGCQTQIPPIYSALKFEGKPLYHYMRGGKKWVKKNESDEASPRLTESEIQTLIEKKRREITIHKLDLHGIQRSIVSDTGIELIDLEIEVDCSKGTYIRSIASDIGKRLGVGGHLIALRRLRTASFDVAQAVSMSDVEELCEQNQGVIASILEPIDCLLSDLAAVDISADEAKLFHQGGVIDLSTYKLDQSHFSSDQELRVYTSAKKGAPPRTLVGLGLIKYSCKEFKGAGVYLRPKRNVLA